MARQIDTTLELVASKTSTPNDDPILTEGYSLKGGVGAATWKHTGVTGLAPSLLPDRVGGNCTLTDSSGNEYVLIGINAEINVSKLGAVGDGVTDDHAPIQSALDYANTNKIPVVKLNGFTNIYKVTQQLHVPYGVQLRGGNFQSFKFVGGNSSLYFTRIDSSFNGAAILCDDQGTNSEPFYGCQSVKGLTIRFVGTTQAVSSGVQIGTVANPALQVKLSDLNIQNFGKGIHNIGTWNVTYEDIMIISTRNPTQTDAPVTYGVFLDAETRAVTSNYFRGIAVQNVDCGYYVSGVASYSSMSQVYADACNIGMWIDGKSLSPGRGMTFTDLGIEAPKHKGLIVDSSTIQIFGFKFVKGISTTYERIVELTTNAKVTINGGDDINTGSYGTVDGMNVDATSDLTVNDLDASYNLMVKGDGLLSATNSFVRIRGHLQRDPVSQNDISFATRDNQLEGFSRYLFLPDGATQSVPTTTGLARPTIITTGVAVGEIIEITNVGLAGDNINLKVNDIVGFEDCEIVRNIKNINATGIILEPGESTRLIKQVDGLLHQMLEANN